MLFNKNRCYDTSCQTSMPKNDIFTNIDIDQNYIKNENMMYGMSMKGGSCGCKKDMNMYGYKHDMNTMSGMGMSGCKMQPVYEQPIEKCVHRTICHEVPHVCPINTRIINHHIYRHTYSPCYSCCEENQVSQVNEGSCCCFK